MTPRAALLSLLFLFTFSHFALSQITISQSSIPSFGTLSTSYATLSNIALNVGPSGENQAWAVPDVAAEIVSTEEIVTPASTPYFDSFATATHAFYSENVGSSGERYSYARIASDGSYGLGAAVNSSGLLVIIEPEALAMPFPATFGTQWSKVTHSVFSPAPGRTVTLYDSTAYHVDGWGTIQTQFGSANVLRIFAHEFNTTVTEVPPQPPVTNESSMYFYEWIKQDGSTAARMNSVDDETNPNFTEGIVAFTVAGVQAIETPHGPLASSFSIGQNYPNPFNPTTSLPISLEKSATVEITIYNELGEVVSSAMRTFSPGEHTVGFDGSAWASGNYFAQVKIGAQQETRRMTLVK